MLKVFQQVGQLLHHRRGEEVRRGIVEQDLQDASSLFYAQVSRARVIAASSLDNERYIKIIIQCDDIVSPTNG
ncbi:hypothetical protein ID032_33600 [Pseudomonas aeruginosa]|uniref:hypothetical protein n=1 Tax=Pseudomonas aeruginosa TaxID=287 RepID=UPI001ADCDE55|nr:hypothetical protein [Pseudomonas aeruginosa]MBO8350631.1 hypothetical protein [Pseudomonas aeruginosa]